MYVISSEEIKANALRELQSVRADGKTEVIIRDHKSSRSIQQNSLYWKWMSILANWSGERTKDDMHREFSIRLLGPELFVVDGKQYVTARSTTSLGTKDFSQYLDQIMATAMQLGVALPTPRDMGLEK